MGDSINDILPNEILSEILSQLAPWDLENCFNTCYEWRQIVHDILRIKGKNAQGTHDFILDLPSRNFLLW